MYPAMHPALRAESSKAILKLFPTAVEPMSLQRSALFALQAAGAVDDRFVLGPYSRPSIIHAVSFVSALDPAVNRTFQLHISTDNSVATLTANDINVLDPQSPSNSFMPARSQVTLPIGKQVPFSRFFIKLSRQKGGSIAFEMTCLVYIKQSP